MKNINDIREIVLKCEELLAKGEIESVLDYTDRLCLNTKDDIVARLIAGNVRRVILTENIGDKKLDNEEIDYILSTGVYHYITALLSNSIKCTKLEAKYIECVNNEYSVMICNETLSQFEFAKIEFVQFQHEYNSNMSIFDSIEQLLKYKYDCDINTLEFVDNLIKIIKTCDKSLGSGINIKYIEKALEGK